MKKRRKLKEGRDEIEALGFIWNWVILGACIKSYKQQDRWLKNIQEMEDEVNRYNNKGCRCNKRRKNA